jgi:osmotically-inducible protein OsmY
MTAAALVMTVAAPLAAASTDSRIESSAKASYNFRTHLKDDAIRVESNGGVVTLTGTVARDYHKVLAEETVSGLPGVIKVNNQLTLVGEQPAERSDGWITMKVKANLTFHKHVTGLGTEVRTEAGVVTLSGKADSLAQKELSGEYAKDVEGVVDVRNNLVVANPPAPERTAGEKVDDASITAQIKTTLLFRKSTHVLATKVKTRHGAVTLHGEARTAAERDLVGKIVADVRGVTSVHNKMTVRKS